MFDVEGNEVWDDPEHPPFIDVYCPIAGWKARLMVWVQYDDGGWYEPWQTGYLAFETRKQAVRDAAQWAEDEEYELRV